MRTGVALDRTDAGLALLSMRGEHDLDTAPSLRAQLDQLIASANGVVIDLSPATFIDSTILGVILEARRRSDDAGVGFAVVQADGDGGAAVSRVLEVTGLRVELPVHASREEGLAAASSGSRKQTA